VNLITQFETVGRIFLKFDLSSLPSGVVITLARLRLQCSSVSSLKDGVTDVQARRVSDDSWTETGITWNNQPAYGSVEDTKVPAVGWVEWTVTGWVQNEWAGDKTVSICLRCVTESYDAANRFSFYRSREYNGDDPELYIEYTVPIAHQVTVSEVLGMSDFIAAPLAAKKTVSDALGMLDSTPTKAAFHLTAPDKLGMVDGATRQKNMFQTVTEILGMVDAVGTRAAFKAAVSEVLGMLDSATRGFPLKVTVSEVLGLRDRVEARRRRGRLGDLPDDTITGGAPPP